MVRLKEDQIKKQTYRYYILVLGNFLTATPDVQKWFVVIQLNRILNRSIRVMKVIQSTVLTDRYYGNIVLIMVYFKSPKTFNLFFGAMLTCSQ